jgi:hypothetical protein
LRISGFIIAGLLALVIATLSPANALAQNASGKIDIDVACHCPDVVGQNFCAVFKQKIEKSVGYQLVDNTSGYGMGVHFACVDMWRGIENKLAGRMSAVSVTFTIYSDKLPGEVFEDSSVFRVGKAKVPEMSEQVVTALGQLVSANTSFFENMRSGAQTAAPEGSSGSSSGSSSDSSAGPSSAPSP